MAITLGVAQALGIDQQTALQGMLNAPPDPGAVEIKYFKQIAQQTSLLMHLPLTNHNLRKRFLNKVESYDYPYSKKIVILNCRSDRVDRTETIR